MATSHVTPKDLPINKVLKALGLEGQEVERLVIDIRADDVVRVYIQRFMNDAACEALAESVSQMNVEKTKCQNIFCGMSESEPVIICDTGDAN